MYVNTLTEIDVDIFEEMQYFLVIPTQLNISSIYSSGKSMSKQFYVYILASNINGTLYIGVTSDLKKRVWQHKNKLVDGFTKKYKVDKLVYYEIHLNTESAIIREKRLKKWNRKWKIRLIENFNPDWMDLYKGLLM